MATKATETKKAQYNNQSITMLKGADRVRKRPAVIFGSDGLEGCEHSFFEILSNAVDEAREGYALRLLPLPRTRKKRSPVCVKSSLTICTSRLPIWRS